VNVFVSELFKFKTGGQLDYTTVMQKPQQTSVEDEDNFPKLTSDELIQLQDQMRKVTLVLFRGIFMMITVHVVW